MYYRSIDCSILLTDERMFFTISSDIVARIGNILLNIYTYM